MTTEPVVPWVFVWAALIAAAAGLILTMSGWGQRETRATERIGQWVLGLALTVAGCAALANGGAVALNVFGGLVKTVVASAQSHPSEDVPTK